MKFWEWLAKIHYLDFKKVTGVSRPTSYAWKSGLTYPQRACVKKMVESSSGFLTEMDIYEACDAAHVAWQVSKAKNGGAK